MHYAIDCLGRGDCLAVFDDFKDLGKIRFRNRVDRCGIGGSIRELERTIDAVDHVETEEIVLHSNIVRAVSGQNGVQNRNFLSGT